MEVESDQLSEYDDPTSVAEAIASALQQPSEAELLADDPQSLPPEEAEEELGGAIETFTTLQTSVPYAEGTIVTFDIQMEKPLETVEVETTSNQQQQPEPSDLENAPLQEQRQTLEARIIKAAQRKKWADALRSKGYIVCTVPGCHMRYSTVESFEEHYMWCTGDKGMGVENCPYCENQFLATDDGILPHILDDHPDDIEDYQVKRGERLAAAITRLVVTEEAKRQAERARKGQSRPTDTLLGRYPDIEAPGMLNMVISKPRIKKKGSYYSKKTTGDGSSKHADNYGERRPVKKTSVNLLRKKAREGEGPQQGGQVVQKKIKPVIIPSRNWSAPRKTYSRNPFTAPSKGNTDARHQSTDTETTDNELDKSYAERELNPMQLRLPQNCAGLGMPADLYDRDEDDVDGNLERQVLEDEEENPERQALEEEEEFVPDLVNGQVMDEQVIYGDPILHETQVLNDNHLPIVEGAMCTVQTTPEDDGFVDEAQHLSQEDVIPQIPLPVVDKKPSEEADHKKRRVIFVVQSKEGGTSGNVLHSGKNVTVLKAILKDGSVLTGKDKLGQPIRAVFKRAHPDSASGQSGSDSPDRKRTKIIIKAAGPSTQNTPFKILPPVDKIQPATSLVQPDETVVPITKQVSSNSDDQVPLSPDSISPSHEIPVKNQTVYPTIEEGVFDTSSDPIAPPDEDFTPLATPSVGRGQSFRRFGGRRRGFILRGAVAGRGFRYGRMSKSGKRMGRPPLFPRHIDRSVPANNVPVVVRRPRGRPPSRSPGIPPGRSYRRPSGRSPGRPRINPSINPSLDSSDDVVEEQLEDPTEDVLATEEAAVFKPDDLPSMNEADNPEEIETNEAVFVPGETEVEEIPFGFDVAAEEVVCSTSDAQGSADGVLESSDNSTHDKTHLVEKDLADDHLTGQVEGEFVQEEISQQEIVEEEIVEVEGVEEEVVEEEIITEEIVEENLVEDTVEGEMVTDELSVEKNINSTGSVLVYSEEMGPSPENIEEREVEPLDSISSAIENSKENVQSKEDLLECKSEVISTSFIKVSASKIGDEVETIAAVEAFLANSSSSFSPTDPSHAKDTKKSSELVTDSIECEESQSEKGENTEVIKSPRCSLRVHDEDKGDSDSSVKAIGKKKSNKVKEIPSKEQAETQASKAKRSKDVENAFFGRDTNSELRRRSLRTRSDGTESPDSASTENKKLNPKGVKKSILHITKHNDQFVTPDSIESDTSRDEESNPRLKSGSVTAASSPADKNEDSLEEPSVAIQVDKEKKQESEGLKNLSDLSKASPNGAPGSNVSFKKKMLTRSSSGGGVKENKTGKSTTPVTKKQPIPSSKDTSIMEVQSDQTTTTNVTETPAKRRGRPPKIRPAASTDGTPDDQSTPPVTIKTEPPDSGELPTNGVDATPEVKRLGLRPNKKSVEKVVATTSQVAKTKKNSVDVPLPAATIDCQLPDSPKTTEKLLATTQQTDEVQTPESDQSLSGNANHSLRRPLKKRIVPNEANISTASPKESSTVTPKATSLKPAEQTLGNKTPIETVVVKRRGRPPLKKKLVETTETTLQPSEKDSSVSPAAASPRSKSKELHEQALGGESIQSKTIETPPVAKRRGRPPWKKSAEKATDPSALVSPPPDGPVNETSGTAALKPSTPVVQISDRQTLPTKLIDTLPILKRSGGRPSKKKFDEIMETLFPSTEDVTPDVEADSSVTGMSTVSETPCAVKEKTAPVNNSANQVCETIEDEISDPVVTPVVPKRRGRPPKKIKFEEAMKTLERATEQALAAGTLEPQAPTTDASHILSPFTKLPLVSPVEPGIPVPTETVDSTAKENEITPVKRRRGRPPKKRDEDLLEQSGSPIPDKSYSLETSLEATANSEPISSPDPILSNQIPVSVRTPGTTVPARTTIYTPKPTVPAGKVPASVPIYSPKSTVPVSKPIVVSLMKSPIAGTPLQKTVSSSSQNTLGITPLVPKPIPSKPVSTSVASATPKPIPSRISVVPSSSEHDPTLLPPQKLSLSSIQLKDPLVQTISKAGRPIRKKKQGAYLDEYLENEKTNQEVDSEHTDEESYDEEDEEEQDEPVQKSAQEDEEYDHTPKPGRKRRQYSASLENSPLRLMREIFPYKNSRHCSIPGTKIYFKCSGCNLVFDVYSKCRDHILSAHNGLANINSNRPVPSEEFHLRLRLALKMKKVLVCHKPFCEKQFRSVMGYITHNKYCGHEVQYETCDVCSKQVRPASMPFHKRRHLAQEQELQKLIDGSGNADGATPTEGVAPRRRQAAIAAKTKLQEFVREEIEEGPDDIQDDGELSDPNDQAYTARKSDEEARSGGDSEGDDDFDEDELATGNGRGVKHFEAKLKQMESFFKYPNKNRSLDKKTNDFWQKELDEKSSITCKERDCEKVFTTKMAMLYHWQRCQITSEWTCLRCYQVTTFKSGYAMYRHLVGEHRLELPASIQATIKTPTAKAKYANTRPAMVQRDYACNPFKTITSVKLPHQALQFCKKHYNLDVFTQWRPRKKNWNIIASTDNYTLPFRESVQFRVEEDGGTLKYNPQKLHLHETTSLKDPVEHITMNVGGPVWASAWCPTPYYRRARQYIAIGVSLEPDRIHLMSDTTPHKGILQIWRAGGILTRLSMESKPCMMLSVAHNYGALWDMCWCPSGAWDDPSIEIITPGVLARLGLLALACGDGSARILSIPHPYESQKSDLYDVVPVAVLSPPDEGSSVNAWRSSCTSVSWQRTDGHSTLLAGYGNGCICQFDLTSWSPLLVVGCNPNVLKPFLVFSAHSSAITKLTFAPVTGSRFCASAGLDRATRIWDLQDTSTPNHEVCKFIVRDLAWNCHWCGYFGAQEECYNLNLTHTFYMECGYFNLPKRPLTCHGACTWGISVSEWLNCQASCDAGGEVIMMGLTESDHSLDGYKHLTLSRMPIYRIELEPVPKDGEDLIDRLQMPTLPLKSRTSTKQSQQSLNWHTPICMDEDDPDNPLPIDNSAAHDSASESNQVPLDEPERTAGGGEGENVSPEEKEGKTPDSDDPQRLKELASCKTYSEITSKYRLVIKDAPMRNLKDAKKEDGKRLATSQTMNHLIPGQYMLASVNTVCWNPNPGCHWWVFSAGQAGLARLSCVSNLNQPIFEKQLEAMQLLARKPT